MHVTTFFKIKNKKKIFFSCNKKISENFFSKIKMKKKLFFLHYKFNASCICICIYTCMYNMYVHMYICICIYVLLHAKQKIKRKVRIKFHRVVKICRSLCGTGGCLKPSTKIKKIKRKVRIKFC